MTGLLLGTYGCWSYCHENYLSQEVLLHCCLVLEFVTVVFLLAVAVSLEVQSSEFIVPSQFFHGFDLSHP